jgi:thiamine pyrophosphate-dependent acetolactate synthase large subunit-like protein
MSKKVADQLVEMMIQAGIKRIYGITGDRSSFSTTGHWGW